MPASGPDGRPGSVRAQFVQALASLQLALDGSLTFPLTIRIEGATGGAVSFQIQSPSELGADPLRGLAPSLQRIVREAPSTPEAGVARKKLARLCGQKYDPHFHARCRQLIDLGLIRETSDERVYRAVPLPPASEQTGR